MTTVTPEAPHIPDDVPLTDLVTTETAEVLIIMRDAAFPDGMHGYPGPIAGYYGGPDADHVWSPGDWIAFRSNRKLPIWVAGLAGEAEADQAVSSLQNLGVPRGSYTALDMEGRVDKTYVEHFGTVLNQAGYKVWVYGSAGFVFAMPPLNGYWVADYRGIGAFMYPHPSVRATQYAPGQNYDFSTLKRWTLARMWH